MSPLLADIGSGYWHLLRQLLSNVDKSGNLPSDGGIFGLALVVLVLLCSELVVANLDGSGDEILALIVVTMATPSLQLWFMLVLAIVPWILLATG